MLESILQVVLSGLQVGGIYALMALSYYVIIRSTDILNFAQGEWLMLSAMMGLVFLQAGVPYVLAVVISVAAAMSVALLAERFVIRRLQAKRASMDTMILSLLGIMIVVRYSAGLILGRQEAPLPGFGGEGVLRLSEDVFVMGNWIAVYIVTTVVFAGVWWFLRFTWIGRSLRVSAIDSIGAALCGVDLGQVRIVAFGIGALIAAVTGWLYAPLYAAGYLIGIAPGIKGFIALFIGGLASPLGSLVGGLALGLTEVAAARFMPSMYSEGASFVILIVVLFFRPNGLIAGRHAARS